MAKKQYAIIIGVVSIIIGMFLGMFLLSSVRAQAEDVSLVNKNLGMNVGAYSSLNVFYAGYNKIGFFDVAEGKIYLYDIQLNRCDKILKLQQLGSPLLELRKY